MISFSDSITIKISVARRTSFFFYKAQPQVLFVLGQRATVSVEHCCKLPHTAEFVTASVAESFAVPSVSACDLTLPQRTWGCHDFFFQISSPQVWVYGWMHGGKQLAKAVGRFSTIFSCISRLHSTLSMSQYLSPCYSVLVRVVFFFLLGALGMKQVGTVQSEGAIFMFLVDFSIIVIMSKSSESGVDVEVVHLSLLL